MSPQGSVDAPRFAHQMYTSATSAVRAKFSINTLIHVGSRTCDRTRWLRSTDGCSPAVLGRTKEAPPACQTVTVRHDCLRNRELMSRNVWKTRLAPPLLVVCELL